MRNVLVLSSFAIALAVGTMWGEEPGSAEPKSTGEIITVKLVIAEISEKVDGQEKAEPLDLTKPGDQVLAQVEALKKQGRARRIQRVELAAVEGHTAQFIVSEIVPSLSGIVFAGGNVAPQHTMTDVGTVVLVTPRRASDDTISLELALTSSRLLPAEIPILEKDLRNFRPAGASNSMIQTTIRVPVGKPTVLTKFETTGEPDAFKQVAIVTAATSAAPAKGD